jgi:hypothetical protein
MDLSDDCVYLILEKVKKTDSGFVHLICSHPFYPLFLKFRSLRYFHHWDVEIGALFSSLPRFLFGIKIGAVSIDFVRNRAQFSTRGGFIGNSAITFAASYGYLEVLKYLHERGLNLTVWLQLKLHQMDI